MKAIVIGATGATGKELVQQLLHNHHFEEVTVFVRTMPEYRDEKLIIHVVDFDHPDHWAQLVKGNVAFSCLGTTLKAAGSKEKQWKIDHDYQYNFAKAARTNGIPHFILVSAYGANARSFVFYNKMKGTLEAAVRALDFPRLTIFRPGMLERPDSQRKNERMALKIVKFINKLGLFRSQQPLPVSVLAAGMIQKALSSGARTEIIQLDHIFKTAIP